MKAQFLKARGIFEGGRSHSHSQQPLVTPTLVRVRGAHQGTHKHKWKKMLGRPNQHDIACEKFSKAHFFSILSWKHGSSPLKKPIDAYFLLWDREYYHIVQVGHLVTKKWSYLQENTHSNNWTTKCGSHLLITPAIATVSLFCGDGLLQFWKLGSTASDPQTTGRIWTHAGGAAERKRN